MGNHLAVMGNHVAVMSASAFRAAALALCVVLAAPAVHAGILEDDEARRAILDLRAKLEQSNEQQRSRLAEAQAQFTEAIGQLRRSLLDLNNQLELLRADNAKLRGQQEQVARDAAELQRKQKDMQAGVDDRIRKIEPQKVTLDGREFMADPEEKRQYDEAIETLRKGDYAATASAFSALRKRYPASGYNETALFWLGDAQYGLRQFKEAMASFRSLVASAPDHPKAPEALLAIANIQAELKDPKAARRTLDELLKNYPNSEAALAGRERLATIK